jgi:nicotinamide-nucleotide amidase
MPPADAAEVVVTGTELLSGAVADVNGPFLARELTALGVECSAITVAGDHAGAVADRLREALGRARLVVVSGGLGPTGDDLTREALARAAGRPLVDVPALEGHFAAPAPEGADQVPNPKGSAAGLWLSLDGGAVAALPGVPWELAAMWPAFRPRVEALFRGRARVASRTLRTVGLSEREVEARLGAARAALDAAGARHGVTARPLAVDLHLKAPSDEALARAAAAAREALGDTVYGEGEADLSEIVGRALRAAGWRVATAESCTGGALAAALTRVPGASDYVDRGVVTYSNAAKCDLLGVPEALIAAHGAVSDPVARAMAEGLLARSSARVTVAVTGIAGPTGGTPDKPVGLVHMAVADASGSFARAFHHRGDRERVIARSVARGLDLLRRYAAGGLAALEAHFPPDAGAPAGPSTNRR